MTNLETFLSEVEHNRGCLVAKRDSGMPNCHEYTVPLLCDCQILKLVEIVRVQQEAIVDIRSECTSGINQSDDVISMCQDALIEVQKILGEK